jgi:signal peptidase I
MEPTLESGSNHFYNSVAYQISSPKVNDIVVYHPPEFIANGEMAKMFFVHRCVGVAGDILEIRDGSLYRNGHLISEPYVQKNAKLDFKLGRYRGEIIPIVTEDHLVNLGNRIDPKFWLDHVPETLDLSLDDPLPVPHGTILVMGDNRAGASDSRSWGTLPVNRVVGKLTGY